MEAIKKDFVKAAAVYKMNCNQLNFGKSCYKYGSYLMIGRGCKQNAEESYSYLVKGCEKGSSDGCFGAGLTLTSNSENQKNDYKKGLEYFDKGCQGDHVRSCFYASGILLKGMGNVPQDFKRAFDFTKKACEFNNPHACANLSQMYRRGEGVTKNEELATKYKNIAMDLQEQAKGNFQPIQFGQTS